MKKKYKEGKKTRKNGQSGLGKDMKVKKRNGKSGQGKES